MLAPRREHPCHRAGDRDRRGWPRRWGTTRLARFSGADLKSVASDLAVGCDGRRRAGSSVMRVRLAVLAVLAVAGLIAVLGVTAIPASGAGHEAEVRISARLLADGRTEAGLQQREADGGWSERLFPRARVLPGRGRSLAVEHAADGQRWRAAAMMPWGSRCVSRCSGSPTVGPSSRCSSARRTASGASGCARGRASYPPRPRWGAGCGARR